jgi:hypothetical protein
MLYEQLWEIAILIVGAFVVAAVPLRAGLRIMKSVQRIEIELSKMEKKINILRSQESRRLMMELKVNSEEAEIDSHGNLTKTGLEPGGAGVLPNDVALILAKPCLNRQNESSALALAHCDSASP